MGADELLKSLDALVQAELGRDALEELLEKTENAFYCLRERRLLPYIALMYYKTGILHLAKYYYSEAARISNLADQRFQLGTLLFPPRQEDGGIQMPGTEFLKNDLFQRRYTYRKQTYDYSVVSFSGTIGKNLTLLKTRHGAILFDCGAARGMQDTEVISEGELRGFFGKYGIAVGDIQAVLISHAHLDHYGSIPVLLRLGVPAARIYMNAATKELISAAAGKDFPNPKQFNSSRVIIPGGVMKVSAFPNGHILGSEGYVVSFDGVNVVYTGDYCLHDQKTAPGLQPQDILRLARAENDGIDCVITETTYGQKTSLLSYGDTQRVFNHVVRKLVDCGYKVLIPSFAIGRSQEIALLLNDSLQIFISGLAAEISRIYAERTRLNIYNENTRFDTGQQEQLLRNFGNHDVILASAGVLAGRGLDTLMDCGGQIAVIRTGYSGSETYGAALLERLGKPEFNITLPVHADLSEIRRLLSALQPNAVVMIHGDGLRLAPPAGKKEENTRVALPSSPANPASEASPAVARRLPKEKDTPAGTPAGDESGRRFVRPDRRRRILSGPKPSGVMVRKSRYKMVQGMRFHLVQDIRPKRFTCYMCKKTVETEKYAEFYAGDGKKLLCYECCAVLEP